MSLSGPITLQTKYCIPSVGENKEIVMHKLFVNGQIVVNKMNLY